MICSIPSLYLELSRDPHRIEAIIGNRASGSWAVLDEIQKIPALLDEVHRLMELPPLRVSPSAVPLAESSGGVVRRFASRAVLSRLGMESLSAAEFGS